MGDAIAHKLLVEGFAVHAWNRTPERAAAVVAAGAVAAHTPFDAVAEADVVVTMLTDGDAVAGVMNDADGGGLAAMTPRCTWIQMGTIGPSWTDDLAALAAARGAPFVDAPVMGHSSCWPPVRSRHARLWRRCSTRSPGGPCGSARRAQEAA
jgi:3-hydroxyisobutyrate dehydrogenase-like beta-hydroxyacid dehydrogenase